MYAVKCNRFILSNLEYFFINVISRNFSERNGSYMVIINIYIYLRIWHYQLNYNMFVGNINIKLKVQCIFLHKKKIKEIL